MLPTSMRAIEISTPGGPDVLKPATLPLPVLGAGEILVKVTAAGVNRPDCLQRAGAYPPPKGASPLPGLEVAGEVVDIADDVERYSIGDKVCALTNGGGYAEYVAVHESHALPVPEGLTMIEAAALPETFFTVWTNVFERGELAADDVFLVHGGTSGIGTTAIQLAKVFGATVIATAGSAAKCEACRKLGADLAIDYSTQDFVAEVKAFTQGHGADVILDMVGGDYIPRNHEAAADQGRIVQIAFLKSPKVEVDFRRLMLKRLVHTGSTLRPRTIAEKGAIGAALEANVWPLIARGLVKPLIHSTFALDDAAKAHALMETNVHIGKIVLIP